MIKAPTTWVLVADGGRARVVKPRGPGRVLELVSEHKAELHRTAALGTDRPGRSHESATTARHAHVTTDFHQAEENAFLRGLAKELDTERQAGRFDRLVVVAPPTALGALRKMLSAPLHAAVVSEIDKDLTKVPLIDLAGHLTDTVPC